MIREQFLTPYGPAYIQINTVCAIGPAVPAKNPALPEQTITVRSVLTLGGIVTILDTPENMEKLLK